MKHDIRQSNGRFTVATDINTIGLVCELDRVCKMAAVPFNARGGNGLTGDETRWLFAVARERPVWAKATLDRYGYRGPQ